MTDRDALIARLREEGNSLNNSRALGWDYAGSLMLEAADILSTPPPAPTDVERMIRECVPGGQSCDPQQVADALRSWFESVATPPSAPSYGE